MFFDTVSITRDKSSTGGGLDCSDFSKDREEPETETQTSFLPFCSPVCSTCVEHVLNMCSFVFLGWRLDRPLATPAALRFSLTSFWYSNSFKRRGLNSRPSFATKDWRSLSPLVWLRKR